MGSKEVVCRNCKTKVDKSKAILHPLKQRIYFCSEKCLVEYDNKALSKNNDNIVSDRRKLTDYIQAQYFKQGLQTNDDINWHKITAQLQQLINNNYQNSGMQYTLYYFCEILGRNLPDDFMIKWIIEYYYNEAEQYYKQLERCNQLTNNYQKDQIHIVFHKSRYNYLKHLNNIDLNNLKR